MLKILQISVCLSLISPWAMAQDAFRMKSPEAMILNLKYQRCIIDKTEKIFDLKSGQYILDYTDLLRGAEACPDERRSFALRQFLDSGKGDVNETQVEEMELQVTKFSISQITSYVKPAK